MAMQYKPDFFISKPIMSDDDKSSLWKSACRYTADNFASSLRAYEELVIDFVYTSGKFEGNTYGRLDTSNLLKLGITTGG